MKIPEIAPAGRPQKPLTQDYSGTRFTYIIYTKLPTFPSRKMFGICIIDKDQKVQGDMAYYTLLW